MLDDDGEAAVLVVRFDDTVEENELDDDEGVEEGWDDETMFRLWFDEIALAPPPPPLLVYEEYDDAELFEWFEWIFEACVLCGCGPVVLLWPGLAETMALEVASDGEVDRMFNAIFDVEADGDEDEEEDKFIPPPEAPTWWLE